jgi:hypothetical protein
MRCIISLFTCNFPDFLMYALMTIKFPLFYFPKVLISFFFSFYFASRNFLISSLLSSTTYYLFKSELFSFHVLKYFLCFFLVLIFSFTQL